MTYDIVDALTDGPLYVECRRCGAVVRVANGVGPLDRHRDWHRLLDDALADANAAATAPRRARHGRSRR